MNGLLVLDRVRVQGANAVAGLTWGFPAVGAFLGFCHALERRLRPDHSGGPALFGGCAIVCHDHQPLTASHYGVHQFNQTRAPLTRKGAVAPFNEEGRMHMTVSLLIGLDDGVDDYLETIPDDVPDELTPSAWFRGRVEDAMRSLRLAGGTILDVRGVGYKPQIDGGEEDKEGRTVLFGCLPGFALVDRSDLLESHLGALRANHPEISRIRAWMDFGNLRFRSAQGDDGVAWERVPLPERGWFVPLTTGYRAISSPYEAGSVAGARDPSVPFVLVESVYGVGQWIGPHRVRSIESLMWRHEYREDGRYVFANRFEPELSRQEEPA